MSYIDDLEECMAKADKYVQEMELCAKKEFWTAFALNRVNLLGVLRSVRHCLKCVTRKKDRLEEKGIDPDEFHCSGGCIRPMSLEKQAEITRKLDYIFDLFPTKGGDNGTDSKTSN